MLARSAVLRLDRPEAAAHDYHAEEPQAAHGDDGAGAGAERADSSGAAVPSDASSQQAAPSLALQLPGGRSLAAFMGLWDQLTARLLPRDATGASADTLLAAIQLLMAASAAALTPAQPSQRQQQQRRQGPELEQQGQPRQWQLPHESVLDGSRREPLSEASAVAQQTAQALQAAAAVANDAAVLQQKHQQEMQQRQHPEVADVPMLTGQLLAVALQLADLSAEGIPVDAEAIAAGVIAEAVQSERIAMDAVQAKLGTPMVRLLSEVAAVHALSDAVDVYDDNTSSALRELALKVYDRRAIVVEVVSRLQALQAAAHLPQHEQQVLALEALQLYAPMGHALGLGRLSATIEDICFQILFPASYSETAAQLRKAAISNEGTLRQCISQLQAALSANVHLQTLTARVELHGRTKSLFSAMRKILRLGDMAAGGRRLEQLHDLLGLRAIVQPRADLPEEEARLAAIEACYIVNDTVRELWPELEGRAKDYILQPKGNNYQSLHTTVEVPAVMLDMETDSSDAKGVTQAQPERLLDHSPCMEIQIRTQEMHVRAEYGQAAHTAYKGRLDSWQQTQLQAWAATAPASLTLPTDMSRSQRAQAAAVELFRHLDTNGDGMLSREEVQNMIAKLAPGGGGDAAAAQEVMDSIADSRTGSIDFGGFLHFFSMIEGLKGPGPAAEVAAESQAVRLLSAPSPASQQPAEAEPSSGAASHQQSQAQPAASSQHAADASQPAADGAGPVPGSSSASVADAAGGGGVRDGTAGAAPDQVSGGAFRGTVRVLAAQVADARSAAVSTSSAGEDLAVSSPQHSRAAARRHQQPARRSRDEAVYPAQPDPLWQDEHQLDSEPRPQHSGRAQPAAFQRDAAEQKQRQKQPQQQPQQQGSSRQRPPQPAESPGQPAAGATDTAQRGGGQQGSKPCPPQHPSANGAAAAGGGAAVHQAPAGARQPAPPAANPAAQPAADTVPASGGKRRPLRRARPGGLAIATLDLPQAGLMAARPPARKVKLRRKAGDRKYYRRLRLVPRDPATVIWQTRTGQPVLQEGLQLPHIGPVVLGSDTAQDCDIVTKAAGIAGRHARLEVVRHRQQVRCMLTDLGSPAGTWHNGMRLKPFEDVRLSVGDVIELGSAPDSNAEDGGTKRQRVAVTIAGADLQPPVRATAVALRRLPDVRGAPAAGFIMESGRVVYLDVAQRAAQLSQDHEFAAARTLLQRHLAASPRNGALWSQLANLERRQANKHVQDASHSAARAFYRAAVEQLAAAGGGSLVSVDASLASVDAGDSASGAAAAAAPPERVNNLTRALDSWAQMEFKLGHHTTARRLFMRSVAAAKAIDSRALRTHVTWARQEMYLANHDLAKELLGKVLDAEPKYAKALHMLALIEAGGSVAAKQKARQLWRRACEIAPRHVPALQAWGRLEAKMRNMAEARRLFQIALDVEPDNEYVLTAWAVAEGRAGRTKRSRQLFRRATAAQPLSLPAWQAWAVMEGEAGDADAARGLFDRAEALKPSAKTLSARATLERRCGNFEEARKLLRRALEVDPGIPSALTEQKVVEKAARSDSESASDGEHQKQE